MSFLGLLKLGTNCYHNELLQPFVNTKGLAIIFDTPGGGGSATFEGPSTIGLIGGYPATCTGRTSAPICIGATNPAPLVELDGSGFVYCPHVILHLLTLAAICCHVNVRPNLAGRCGVAFVPFVHKMKDGRSDLGEH